MSRRKNANKIIGSNLALARIKAHITQQELVDKIAELTGSETTLQQVTVSLWETGRRSVPDKYQNVIAAILNVDIEWLRGNIPNEDNYNSSYIENITIATSELKRFDGCPVWVEFEFHDKKNGWALVDIKMNRLIFKGYILNLSSDLKGVHFYTAQPNGEASQRYTRKTSLSMASLMNSEKVFIVMNTNDNEIASMYNGWYWHNETRNALINERGLVLKYTGLNIGYEAYSSSIY